MKQQKKIAVSGDVKEELRKYGRFGESYNDVIVRLMSHADSCNGFVEDWF